MPRQDLENNISSHSSAYTAKDYFKTGFVFVTTTAAFLLVKATGLFPSGLWSSKRNESANNALTLTKENTLTNLIPSESLSLEQSNEITSTGTEMLASISGSDIKFEELKLSKAAKDIVELDAMKDIYVPNDEFSPMKRKLLTLSSSTGIGSGLNLNNGLIAYYPFNGNANDESGNNKHGTVYGARLAKDFFGNENQAYYFDGNGAYICTSLYTSLAEATYSALIKPVGFEIHGYSSSIIDNGDGNACGEAMLMFGPEGITAGRWYSICGYTAANFTQLDVWYHTIAVFSQTSTQIYVNGQLISSIPVANLGDIYNSYDYYCIGGIRGGSGEYFNGTIDQVRVYSRALLSNEIQMLFSLDTTPASSSSSSTADSSSNAIALLSSSADSIFSTNNQQISSDTGSSFSESLLSFSTSVSMSNTPISMSSSSSSAAPMFTMESSDLFRSSSTSSDVPNTVDLSSTVTLNPLASSSSSNDVLFSSGVYGVQADLINNLQPSSSDQAVNINIVVPAGGVVLLAGLGMFCKYRIEKETTERQKVEAKKAEAETKKAQAEAEKQKAATQEKFILLQIERERKLTFFNANSGGYKSSSTSAHPNNSEMQLVEKKQSSEVSSVELPSMSH